MSPRNKYGARRTPVAELGFVADSAAEAERARLLKAMADGRVVGHRISELEFHPAYVLSRKPSCRIMFDARYRERDGVLTVEDVKGAIARDFRVRLLWFRSLNPGVRVRIVRRVAPWHFEEVVIK